MAGKPRGGEFLLDSTTRREISTPEKFTAEQQQISQTARDFVAREILSREKPEESVDPASIRQLFLRCGELGLLGISVPERFGGLGLEWVTQTLVAEKMAAAGSFANSYGGHVGLGTLPLVYFGSEEQKRKYLPEMAAGRCLGAFALTEAGAGSDPLASRTTAAAEADGQHFLLNGEKLWVTNAGFADLLVTFAKIDGRRFTPFLVERNTPGVSFGAEERKMGLHGSSTRALILEDARVPVANLLAGAGRGADVAFSILNLGRTLLGAECVGTCKIVLAEAVRYAAARRQFGRPIVEFGAIREKLAEMGLRTWVAESVVYRTAGLTDGCLRGADPERKEDIQQALQEFAIECSIAKVAASECLDFVVDEGVQILGGYGFCRDYPMERHYRDARIHRIFEGTNEVNRLLIAGMPLRRADKGMLPRFESEPGSVDDPTQVPGFCEEDHGRWGTEFQTVAAVRRVARMILAAAQSKWGGQLREEQEILLSTANILIDLYGAESVLLRAWQAAAGDWKSSVGLAQDIARLYLHEARGRVEREARRVLSSLYEGGHLAGRLAILGQWLPYFPLDTIAVRRRIAEAVIS